jgi:hypothetical protein
MPRAILRNGVIYPVDPLPSDWADGKELQVEEAENQGSSGEDDSPEAAEKWYQELNSLCADNDETEVAQLEANLKQIREADRALERRRAGLE